MGSIPEDKVVVQPSDPTTPIMVFGITHVGPEMFNATITCGYCGDTIECRRSRTDCYRTGKFFLCCARCGNSSEITLNDDDMQMIAYKENNTHQEHPASLRQYYAAMAMQGMLSNSYVMKHKAEDYKLGDDVNADLAKESFRISDAMISFEGSDKTCTLCGGDYRYTAGLLGFKVNGKSVNLCGKCEDTVRKILTEEERRG